MAESQREQLATRDENGPESFEPTPVERHLGMWDAVSIIVGIVVGTAIFRSPSMVFQNVSGPWQALGIWLLGGILCLFGALCYAELATTYPRNGGDYEYLSRAYGRWSGFLFGWAQLAVILTGSIGAMAYAFADYAASLWQRPEHEKAWIAAAAVVAITLLNLLGIFVGKTLQNVLSSAKILGLIGVVAAGLAWGRGASFQFRPELLEGHSTSLGMALVFVLYAYGGWNDAVFVAAEVRDPQRNLPRALILGLLGITGIYLAVNAAYLAVLGFEAARNSATPAADVLQNQPLFGDWGANAISVLVMVSALGAINGMILAGSRVYATVGEDHRMFAWLGRWSSKDGAPAAALVAQATISLLLIFGVGTQVGRNLIDNGLTQIGLARLPWTEYFGGFDTLVAGTAPVFWAFFLLTGLSLFVLRFRDAGRERPFRVPLYPLPPIVFCSMCVYMLYSSLNYAESLAMLGLFAVALGLLLYGLSEVMVRFR